MKRAFRELSTFAAIAVLAASCNSAISGDSNAQTASGGKALDPVGPFDVSEYATLNEPWAMAFEPGTNNLFITEKKGTLKFLTPSGELGEVTGVPAVGYGGQGGLGDIAFSPDYATSKRIYLSWAQQVSGSTPGAPRRAVVGSGKLACSSTTKCAIEGLQVIWQQEPAIASAGHFSHRMAFSPDGKYLFVGSGERMQGAPAQDLGTNLGKVVRLNLDGSPAAGNPFADRGGVSAQIWSYGHRNLAGLEFDGNGELWDIEHGPAGGDEINHVRPGQNYGWPVRSNGNDYSGADIPDHTADDGFTKPAISWNPVIAPGDFIFYSGDQFPAWKGNAIAVGLRTNLVVRIAIDGEKGTEAERIDMGMPLRDIEQGPDGALWVISNNGKVLKLTPKS